MYTYKLDERTVADWQIHAGLHCEKIHKDKIEQGNLYSKQAQIDEIRVKARGMVIWMGLAIMVPTRLWVAGLVSKTRDSNFTDTVLLQRLLHTAVTKATARFGRGIHLQFA